MLDCLCRRHSSDLGLACLRSTHDAAGHRTPFRCVWVRCWSLPRLSLTNAGIDTNVFNQPDAEGPESDFTLTLTPSADLWLRTGPTWVFGNVREDIVWFKEFVSERSVNSVLRVGWLVPLNRLAFNVGTGWTHTNDRPGYEIDARADRQERDLTGAVELRTFSRTRLGVRAGRRRIAFEEGETYMGVDLREELTRTTTAFAFVMRHELTPLTTLAVSLDREQDRFLYSSLRDSDTGRVQGNVGGSLVMIDVETNPEIVPNSVTDADAVYDGLRYGAVATYGR